MRRLLNGAFLLATAVCAVAVCAILLGLVVTILVRALPSLHLDLLTKQMAEAGASGGIRYEILGTLLLMVSALAVSTVLAVALALTKTIYVKSPRIDRCISLGLYTLNGMPSIVFGIVGMAFFMGVLGWGKSWLSGGILLGMMILPTMSIALIERIESLPGKYTEAAASLGLDRSQIIWSVVLPQSVNGLLSGSLLGVARAAGETAPIMFTAAVFSGATLPQGIRESPVVALPYHIFV
ncbi:MAG TPA: ABC transporter permease subunit, partial [Thermoanaerobaculia bacterium]|nr:ABC transporter permease subunit [Thermoanaerobaculia bacterium]